MNCKILIKHRFGVFIIPFIFCFPGKIFAQTYYSNITATAASFLTIAGDIPQAGMGNAGIATNTNEYSSFSNIAKIPYGPTNAFSISYTPWLTGFGTANSYLSNFSYYGSINDKQSLACNIRYANLGSLQLTDQIGNIAGNYSPSEMSIEGSYIQKINDRFSIGGTLKYIHSSLLNTTINNITYHPGNAIAMDFAVLYNGENTENTGFSLGFTLNNLGNKLKYGNTSAGVDFLPASMGIGAAYKITFEQNTNTYILFAVDLTKLLVPVLPISTNDYINDSIALIKYTQQSVPVSWLKSFSDGSNQFRDFNIGIGTEFGFNETVYSRLGFSYVNTTTKYFTIGLGLKYQWFGSYLGSHSTNIQALVIQASYFTAIQLNT